MNDFFRGARDVSPFIAGISPFGFIYGITAAKSGLTLIQGITMSQIIFAGASQLALIEQLKNDGSFLVIIVTVFMINLRMAMYSASLAQHFNHLTTSKKMFLSYFLVDQSYAVSISEFNRNPNRNRYYYYLGAGVTMWTVWQISTILGIAVGTSVPKSLSLEFAIPLTFIALLSNFLRKSYFIATAITSAILMVIFKPLPYNAGFFIAVFAGVFVGRYIKRGLDGKL